ncbi:very short patch repair endonuclease [Actinopolymorpha sp. B9G3]|uniref:very short patch repair endonuclease n=1 Tax=Actinopolymorpha sp. B9G3 TaxID=3158970 RepID=UPI0032D980B4
MACSPMSSLDTKPPSRIVDRRRYSPARPTGWAAGTSAQETAGRSHTAEGGSDLVPALGRHPDAARPEIVRPSRDVSERMSRHPRKDTAPEMELRRTLHSRGLRYRVHVPVPGMARRKIDIAFLGPKLAVFVDGCFWHGCPRHGMLPRNNREWWRLKLDGNQRRDRETTQHLMNHGWNVLRLWCHESTSDAADKVCDRLGVSQVR